MAPLHEASSAAFIQLAARFTLSLALIMFSGMGIVDGLIFRRVRLKHGVTTLATIRGFPAQVIGVACVFAELIGLGFLAGYVDLLKHYCGADVGCFVTTPVIGLVAEWPLIIGNSMVLFCFFYWLWRRRAEVAAPSDQLPYSLPSVYRFVNGQLDLFDERPLNHAEVRQIMEYVEQHAPLVVPTGVKQVMEGKRLDPEKLAEVFLADTQFHEKDHRTRIALRAITEAYIATRQPTEATGHQL